MKKRIHPIKKVSYGSYSGYMVFKSFKDRDSYLKNLKKRYGSKNLEGFFRVRKKSKILRWA